MKRASYGRITTNGDRKQNDSDVKGTCFTPEGRQRQRGPRLPRQCSVQACSVVRSLLRANHTAGRQTLRVRQPPRHTARRSGAVPACLWPTRPCCGAGSGLPAGAWGVRDPGQASQPARQSARQSASLLHHTARGRGRRQEPTPVYFIRPVGYEKFAGRGALLTLGCAGI